MDKISRAIERIETELTAVKLLRDEPMKKHTSFSIGGNVRALCIPAGAPELAKLCEILREFGLTPLIIGNGSNLLVDDRPLDLIAIKTTGLCDIAMLGESEIIAASGVTLAKAAMFALENELTGFEFAHGIPGTLGGAIAMNAGAYGGEMKDVIRATSVFNVSKGMFTIENEEHEFTYRGSRFTKQDSESVIISTIISLRKGYGEIIKAAMEELIARRNESQPLDFQSAGSTFKRPAEGYAAEYIEKAGLKGFSVGGASVSEKHSGFIINRGNAAFSDVMAVIGHVSQTVYKKFGVELETEIKIIRAGR